MNRSAYRFIRVFSLVLFIGLPIRLSGSEPISYKSYSKNNLPKHSILKNIGENLYPTDPMNDRAKGYLLNGKVKSAVLNYGNFIDWNEHPAGLWGEYTYLPHLSFLAGVPGHEYSSKYTWAECGEFQNSEGDTMKIWCSSDAYATWFDEGDTNFVGIVFETQDDRGIIGKEMEGLDFIDDKNQWGISDLTGEIFISIEAGTDPNMPNAMIGLIRPWALRPGLIERLEDYDLYDYGEDQEEWTEDDGYTYYGANVVESWFTRWVPSVNTDWHASTGSAGNVHGTEVTAGDIFGDTPFSDSNDLYPLLAHSNFVETWPVSNAGEPFWPGWWAEDYNDNLPGCDGAPLNPDCWEEVPGRFISDTDVYMEFDDRWAHRGNRVDSADVIEYEQTGYPLGLRVRAEVHSYGVAFAEDILFVTVKVRNESGDWTDENEFHEGMIMPDGTKLNRGKGFDYKGMYLGFHMDADVVSTDIDGNFGVHTNQDDFMKYYWEKFNSIDDSLLISMTMIGDYDGISGIARGFAMGDGVVQGNDFGIVATQLLDTPLATDPVDLDQDGLIDIYPGEPLKMTDWHWFDWYNRPGVVYRESNIYCCAGEPGRPQARNKEEIMYKLMAGDTTNLSENEKEWFFHTANPDLDSDLELNPHFDSLEGIEFEDVFNQGLDCVVIISSGPFDLDVGKEVPFSFAVIFGKDEEVLIQNARMAQIMYTKHYQGLSPPDTPMLDAFVENNVVTLSWDDIAEYSRDRITGYSDFEGYKIYKSTDGGQTWGAPEDRIFDDNGMLVGWRPYIQFDLTAWEDSLHCNYENDICNAGENRGIEISGPDPKAPWFHLGNNTGLPEKNNAGYYVFFDTINTGGMEYTYSVTAYDMGIEADYTIQWIDNGDGTYTPDTSWSTSNPDHWVSPDGFQSLECAKGISTDDANFVTISDFLSLETNILPTTFALDAPYPNPFNPVTTVNYSIPYAADVTIKTFDLLGHQVVELVNNYHEAGEYTILWDASDLSSGIYFIVMQSDEFRDSRKVILLK